jgi:hypothetical protein
MGYLHINPSKITGYSADGSQWSQEFAENGTVTFRAPGLPGGMDPGAPMSWMKDDFDKNRIIGLSDAVLCMRILAKLKMTTTVGKESDVNGDGVIGLPDMIYVLQKIAGLR